MMMLWSGFVIVFGVVLMGAGFAATDGIAAMLYRLLGGIAPAFDPPLRFSVGLMGAVTFGWGLTVVAVASVSHLLDPETSGILWRRIGWALTAWFVIDSTISIANGFGLNAVSNTLLIATFMLILRRSSAWPSEKSRGLASGPA
jgi:hypothetical protein